MWIAIGTVVICKIRQMRKKSKAKKLFEKGGIGYKISKRFTLAELKAAAKVIHAKTADDKKTLIINILAVKETDYKQICAACNLAKKRMKEKGA